MKKMISKLKKKSGQIDPLQKEGSHCCKTRIQKIQQCHIVSFTQLALKFHVNRGCNKKKVLV